MIRLYVDYTEKEEVKKYGARWNPAEKFWYYDGEVLPAELENWSTPRALPANGASRQRSFSYRTGQSDSLPGNGWSGTVAAKGTAVDGIVTGDPLVDGMTSGGMAMEGMSAGGTAIDGFRENPLAGISQTAEWLKPYHTVSEVNEMIKRQYGNTPQFRQIMVVGEVTNFTAPNRGNYYFDIKDEKALLPCIMWGSVAQALLSFRFQAGVKVAITGYLDLYVPNGKTSLIVRNIRDAGQGDAALALLRLQARLEAEGLFDEKFKKPIPKYPSAVGIVTSKDGKAIGDILKTASERNPYVQLLLYHVNVQGKYAVDSIIEGLRTLDQMGLDTIIVGRGGGSDEELMVYNDERIVRAVFQAVTPVISAVGHEGNWTLTDYAADYRESTPTKAAVKAFPDVLADQRRLAQLQQTLNMAIRSQLQQRRLLLDAKLSRLQALDPRRVLKEKQDRLQALTEQLQRTMKAAYDQRRHRCEVLITQLHGLSPTAKLVKGFGYISIDDKPVTTINQVHEGADIRVRIHDGQICAKVTETIPAGENINS